MGRDFTKRVPDLLRVENIKHFIYDNYFHKYLEHISKMLQKKMTSHPERSESSRGSFAGDIPDAQPTDESSAIGQVAARYSIDVYNGAMFDHPILVACFDGPYEEQSTRRHAFAAAA